MTPTNPAVLPTRAYAAFLFDMDGTILTSIKSAERVWSAWALRHGLDPDTFVPTIHGKRTEDTIRKLGLPGVDPVAEALGIALAEIEDVADIEEIAGVGRFLASLPSGRWAIVTSASRPLATARIRAAGLPLPPLLVAAEDVKHGKPAPDPFLLGAKKLGVAPQDCLVFEDTPIGLAAAESAGMDSIIVTATHTHPVETRSARVPDYADLVAVRTESGLLKVQRRIGH
ncbi:HAD-IA family hydrolase [Massilia sp. MS-15]|uniref:HAD-IA family hydrolase n=1 Tax=Massilia sp. MS-15 TaxID=2878200 RepID=UPI001CD6DABE|nr:HAD-IA family hydrolase [Massilia sp. MS-15]